MRDDPMRLRFVQDQTLSDKAWPGGQFGPWSCDMFQQIKKEHGGSDVFKAGIR